MTQPTPRGKRVLLLATASIVGLAALAWLLVWGYGALNSHQGAAAPSRALEDYNKSRSSLGLAPGDADFPTAGLRGGSSFDDARKRLESLGFHMEQKPAPSNRSGDLAAIFVQRYADPTAEQNDIIEYVYVYLNGDHRAQRIMRSVQALDPRIQREETIELQQAP